MGDASNRPLARSAGLVLAGIVLLLVGIFESGTAIAKDDFGYLMWGLLTRGDLLAWVDGPNWFTYRRPLNALAWWLSAQTGIDAELVRWSQVGLWALFGAALLLTTRHSRRGLITVVLLLLTNQVFVDLLHWRSWITTTGTLAFLALSALAMERRSPALTVALLGTLALGFKEVGAVAVAIMALSRPGYRLVGAVLVAGLCVGSLSSAHKLGFHFLMDNVRFHTETVALFAPVVPVLIAARFPKLPAWTLLLCAGMVVLPAPVVAVAVVGASLLFLLEEARWLPAAAVAFGLPFVGAYHARQYLLESWAVVLLALATAKRFSVPTTAWLAMVVLAAPSAVDFERNRAKLREEFASQRAFLRDFKPPPARYLYHPDIVWSWDLDALTWVQGGATLQGQPPPGARPAQTGPLSGVWADLEPASEPTGEPAP
ncbi:MAG: hypothetical protein Q8P18_13665 [Pseudomonadota bacterium]|nr:hypothetical protein [Pseudomonadota bacterium]